MTEFTSGPWLPEKGFCGWWSVVASSTGYEIARIESGEANARLVAAAPEMYEAAVHLISEWHASRDIVGAIDRMKAALAKARGETT